jgi:para-aminobenzoate synthetase/4-amino-4-deoxychorismate lyase
VTTRPPVEVIRRPLGCTWSPAEVALALRGEPGLVALSGRWFGGHAVIAHSPRWTAEPAGGADPFALLDEASTELGEGSVGLGDEPVAIGGGVVGYLGYQAGRLVERLPPSPRRPHALPDWHLAWYDHVLHRSPEGRWCLEALAGRVTEAEADRLASSYESRLAGGPPRPDEVMTTPFVPTPTGADHMKAVARTIEHIRAGDIYQANICLRLDAELVEGTPLDLWATAVEALDPDHAAFLDLGDGRAVASLSPERFLRRKGRRVSTTPIKGTRPRVGADADLMRVQLAGSEKDRAENVMIVDLMRNDLGRVCRPGSIAVPRLFDLEPHAGVWHLVSEVTGELRDDVGDGGLVRASFPPGSVTGAPKVRAMEIITEVEATAREVYTGAIGMVSAGAGADWNVAIRTFEHAGDAVWLGVGGGIVADSDPDAELAECRTKGAPLVAALGGSIEPMA